ncbi:hypothetical protein PVAND_016350 [Polypedilum vanderplanki]|uniref:Uncharacterized protein n=1 Tax=Polypedilum vanderplanki TaxID=319348 RepID=A0A9J6BFD0_POLVA|nr:hypothetical protein PVAND_016350 [Polypedilum vanderplanki]
MSCVSTFCCGYSLRSGGSFIGYFSIFVYMLLTVLCIIVLWCIKLRIDDASPNSGVLKSVSFFIRARTNNNEVEETLQDLKIYSIFFLVYCLFLLFGVLCASFLITGSQLRKPGYLWWWLIYQPLFVLFSAGIIIIFINIKDEQYGLTSYFKNFFFKIIIITFISIYAIFVLLLIYFWICVLSLHTQLRRNKGKKRQNDAVTIVDSSGNLNEVFNNNNDETDNANNTAGTSSSSNRPIQMIPISLGNGKDHKDNGKVFIIRV